MDLMKEINEAAYKGGGRGSIEWIINSFFEDEEEYLGKPTQRLYKLKPGLIAIHKGRLIELIEVDTEYEQEYWFHPLNEEPFQVNTLHGDNIKDFEIYQAKKIT